MKITDSRSVGAVSRTKAKGKTSKAKGRAFAEHLADTSSDTVATDITETAPAAGISGILAVQEAGDQSERGARQAAVRGGEDILDSLDEIRRDLLFGAIPKARLVNLAQMLRNRRRTISDPGLIEILRDIELRAQVELAKYSPR